MKPNGPMTVHLEDGENLHLSMVSLGAEIDAKSMDKSRSVVQVTVEEKTYALCVLTAGRTDCFSLDINFSGEIEIIFSVTGPNPVSSQKSAQLSS